MLHEISLLLQGDVGTEKIEIDLLTLPYMILSWWNQQDLYNQGRMSK